MITLDERLARARADLDAIAVPPVPPLEFPTAPSGGRRRPVAVLAVLVAAAAVVATLVVVARTDHRRSIVSVDSGPDETTTPAAATTSTASSSTVLGTVAATTTPSSSPSSTATRGATDPTTIPAPDGVAEVVPLRLGRNGLVFVSGAWGTTATTTVQADGIHVDLGALHAVVDDIGPGNPADAATSIDMTAPLAVSSRLGPLGPPVDVTTVGDHTTATTTIGDRTVRVAGNAGSTDLLDLLRSVTTPDRVRPIRLGSSTVTVPDVDAMDYRQATTILEGLGLRAVWRIDLEAAGDLPTGVVRSSTPPAAAAAAVGSEVVLDVAVPKPSRRPDMSTMQPVGAPLDEPFNGTGSLGYIAIGGPSGPPATFEQTQPAYPVVFLHGELVGRFTSGYSGPASTSALLTDMVDPDWSAAQLAPQPDLPPVEITQHVSDHGLNIGAPANWTIAHGSCPMTRAIVVLTTAGTSGCPDVPAPWVTIGPAPPALTPCSLGWLNQVAVCTLDSRANRLSSTIYVELGEQVTVLNSTNRTDNSEAAAIQGAISGGTPDPEASVWPGSPALAAVHAALAGDCPSLSAMAAPASAVLDCATASPTSIATDDLTAIDTRPLVDPDDLTHQAFHVALARADLDPAWYVETQTFFDGATHRTGTMIVALTDPTGQKLVVANATHPSGNSTLPPEL